MSLNLSNQPFVNSRPVRRLVFVLWCLGVLLLGANVFFYARHFSGQQDRSDRLAELDEQQSRERARLDELEAALAGFDVRWQQRQVEFLNLRIAERVFPWSRLFDLLTEALPREVRLTRLKPEIRGQASSASGAEETVRLQIRAEARNEEAMLGFVNRLFEHPAFRSPDLFSENRREDSSVTEFALAVTYLPDRAAADETAEEAPAAAGAEPAEAAETGGEQGGDGGEGEADEQDDEPREAEE